MGPIALIFAVIAPYRGLFVIAYTYVLLVLTMYLWVRELGPRILLRRRLLVEWAQVGDELEEYWELINNARLPLLWLEIEDASTLPGYSGRRVAAAGIGDQRHWTTQARCEQRGVYTLGPLIASLSDPFGLFRYEWREDSARQIVIYPPLVQLPALIVPQGQRGGLSRADILQQHVTPSVGGLREYIQGDPPSHIHWPTVAKTDKLMVKEFDQERAGALWIALDLYAGAYQLSDERLAATSQTADRPTGAIHNGHDKSVVFQRSAVDALPSGVSKLDFAAGAGDCAGVLTGIAGAGRRACGRAAGRRWPAAAGDAWPRAASALAHPRRAGGCAGKWRAAAGPGHPPGPCRARQRSFRHRAGSDHAGARWRMAAGARRLAAWALGRGDCAAGRDTRNPGSAA